MSEKPCNCVGKDHQLGCPELDTLFAAMLKPKRTTKEAEQIHAEIQEQTEDEVVRVSS